MKRLFGDSARAFGTLSLILVLLLAVVPAKDHFREWNQYQHRYLSLVRGRSEGPSLVRRMRPGVQQAWLPELGVTDRCTTCHMALQEASLGDVKAQPFRPHPAIPHSLTEFGCVACHGGQGVATTVESAHYSTLDWEQPMLPARYSTALCGQCHWRPLKGAVQLNSGRTLLASYGCVHCHTIKMPDGQTPVATDDPPPLEHVASKTSREWIYAWLKNPQGYSTSATMPNFQLSDADARDISAYLIAQSTPSNQESAFVPAAVTGADPQAGASLYGESYCASCHAVQNAAGALVGGTAGPELTGVGTKVKTDWLAQWLRNPGEYDPGTAMPHYRFTGQQIGLLVGFLGGKTAPDYVANVHLDTASNEQIQHGKTLVNDLGCASCHTLNGVKRPDNFAPELTEVGSRRLARLQFAPGVPHALADYIAAKIRQPRSFGTALRMPQYTLTTTQVDALTTALLAQTEHARTLPASLRMDAPSPSTYRAAGKAGQLMDDMRCYSCHRINGRGGEMAPELTWEGSSVQRAWLVNFLKNPNTLRPALIRRMPRFNMTDSEANTLADYVLTVYQTPAFESDANLASTDAARGKDLYYGKYACNSCHILDGKTDKGYIGPTLTGVGARLSSAWIFHWLKDAQSLRPGVMEPKWNMNDEDAKAITAFLMRQNKTQGGGQ